MFFNVVVVNVVAIYNILACKKFVCGGVFV